VEVRNVWSMSIGIPVGAANVNGKFRFDFVIAEKNELLAGHTVSSLGK